MGNLNKYFLGFLLFVGVFSLSGCVTAQIACMEEWKVRNPSTSEDERLALFYGSKGRGCIHEWFLILDQNSTPQVNYQKIQLDKILSADLKQLKDVEEILDPKNEQWFKLVQEAGLRSYLEAQERARKFRVARMKLVLNHNEFRKLLGETSFDLTEEQARNGYDVKIFLPDFEPARDAPFRAKYVDEAKENRRLVLIGKTIVFDYELFGKKEQDPEFPQNPNRFLWKEKAEGVEVEVYKIMDFTRPIDKRGSYLEATRIVYYFDRDGRTISTQRESIPALRIFVSYSEQLDVVVLDADREGELGFGYPDVVEKLVLGISSGKDLYLKQQNLLAKIFEERVRDRRVFPPPPKDQKFEFVDAGTKVDFWEKSTHPQGWSVASEYKNDKQDNYYTEIVFKLKKPDEKSTFKQIAYIKKIYYMPGNDWQRVRGEVVEYYRPLQEFAEKNIVEAKVDFLNRKKIIIEREGKPTISGVVTTGKNIFIDKIFRIDYTEGEQRWRLEDRDNENRFSYRMEILRSFGGSAVEAMD